MRPGLEQLEDRSVPATFTVTTTADSVAGSLRDAIQQVNSGPTSADNTIILGAGTYTLTNLAGGDLDISNKVTIQGAGDGWTFIDAAEIDRVFHVHGATVTFKNLTIQGGMARDNGFAVPPFTTDSLGGGIFNDRGAVTLDHVTIKNNTAEGGNGFGPHIDGYNAYGGGVYSVGGTVTVIDSTFLGNFAFGGEGQVGVRGVTGDSGDDGVFEGEDGSPGGDGLAGGAGGNASGGGLYVTSGVVSITGSHFESNLAIGGKGADGGDGGNGGKGGDSGAGPGGDGGRGGNGGAAGAGGSGTGGGIAGRLATIDVADTRLIDNEATGGDGGRGGAGETSGRGGEGYTASTLAASNAVNGNGGQGGAFGAGGLGAGGGLYSESSAVAIRSSATQPGMEFFGNRAEGGDGGGVNPNSRLTFDAGSGGSGHTGGAGASGGRGGDAEGGAVAAKGGSLGIDGARLSLNAAVGGKGGQGGVGGSAHDGFGVDPGVSGPGGSGGMGGDAKGGGIHAASLGSALTITRVTVAGNTLTGGAGGKGATGGAGDSGSNSEGGDGGVGGNGGTGGTALGGGIASLSPVTITSSTISGNSGVGGNGGNAGDGGAGGNGGDGISIFHSGDDGGDGGNGGNGGTAGSAVGAGVYLAGRSGSSTMTNVTVVNNSAVGTATGGAAGSGGLAGEGGEGGGALADGDRGWNGSNGTAGGPSNSVGGGIYLNYFLSNAGITINHATIVGNSAGVLGGVAILPGIVNIYNSIIAQNTGGSVADVDITQIWGVNSHNFIGGNPNLGPLQDNGGPTLTRAPLVGSPVIDAGNDSAPGEPTSDQRGLPRKFSTHGDIGAVELPIGLVQITGSAPSTIPWGHTVAFTLTLTVGDDVRNMAVTNDFSGLSFGAVGSSYTLPSGWTTTLQNGDLTFKSPGFGTGTGLVTPGIYTFTVFAPTSAYPPGSVLTDHVTVSYNLATGGQLTKQVAPDLSVTVSYSQPVITSVRARSRTHSGLPIEGSELDLVVEGLTTEGRGFGLDSKVYWNGAELNTTYISPSELRATVPASLAESGTAAIKVVSPTPGGGTSNTLNVVVDNVAPTGTFSDRFISSPRSLLIGLTDIADPSLADAASLHYSYALSQGGLATTYATASDLQSKFFDFTATTTVWARVFDKDGGQSTYSATVHLVTDNDAPVLTGANDLPSINEDDTGNNGVSVWSLIAGKIIDPDHNEPVGIAVVGLTSGNGKWQYSVDDGTTWRNFVTFSNTQATTLSATPTDRVRFVPNGNDGTEASISFRAWDLTDGGLSGSFLVNTTNNGGGTAFSTAIATAHIRVTEINDRPPAGQSYSTTMDQNTTLTIPYSTLFANISAGAPDESGQSLQVLTAVADVIGTQVVITGNTLEVTPPAGLTGTFQLRVRFTDDGTTNGSPDPLFQDMVVNITVRQVNSPPVAVDDLYFAIANQGAVLDFDPSLLTFNDSVGPDHEVPFQHLTVTSVDNASAYGGTVSVVNGRVIFTLDANFSGMASFDYTIQDDGLTGGNLDPKTDTGTFRVLVQPTNLTAATGIGPAGGKTYWGDYDADGDLDVLAIGLIDSDPSDADTAVDDPATFVYRNDGNGAFTDLGNLGLPALKLNAAPQWVDFNKDGYLDVLSLGDGLVGSNAKLYQYDTAGGQFVDAGINLLTMAGITWSIVDGHFDDVVGPLVWTGEPNPAFTNLGIPLTVVFTANLNSEFAWADYNDDGYLDVVAYGPSATRVYRNDANNALTEVASLGGSATADWADFDEDGDLDLLLTSGVYENEGNDVFTSFRALTNVQHAAWGDVTGDGKLDIVYSSVGFTRVDTYNGASFATDQTVPFTVLQNGNWIALGDYDRDGDLDFLLDGNLYVNFGALRNQTAPPTDLTVEMLNSTTAQFSWTPPSDATSAAGLTYTIRLGTTPGGSELMAPLALSSGVRQISDFGLIDTNTLTVTGLTRGQTYYWTVQAVDNSFHGSTFAVEQSFLAECLPTSSDTTLGFLADHPSPVFFPFQDRDNDPLDSVEIVTLPDPVSGTLFLNGTPVMTPGAKVSRDDLQNGKLVFLGRDDGTTWFTETSFDFRVSSKNPSGTEFASAETYTATVTVYAAATEPIVTVADVTGGINTPVTLGIVAQLVDTDGSETLSLKIDGVPGGATLSAGTQLNGTWYMTQAQLNNLTLIGQIPHTFTVTVTATASENASPIPASTVASFDVTLIGPEINEITVPDLGVEGQPVALEADAESSGAGTLTYTWTITNQADQSVTQKTGASTTFTAPDNGLYKVSLKIDDSAGGSLTTQDYFVDIGNANPDVTLGAVDNSTAVEGELLSFASLFSFSDSGYGPTETISYFIDWGDGSAPIQVNLPSQSSSPTAGSVTAGHTYADDGIYQATVVVFDDDGGVAVASFEVTVTSANPMLSVVGNQTLDEGQTLTLATVGTITDAGFANPFRGTDETFTYSINWDDNTPPTTGTASITQVGSAGTPTAGSFGGSHFYADNGVYTVEVSVTDDDGAASEIKTFTVTVNDRPPTASAGGPYSVAEGASINLAGSGDPGSPFDAIHYEWDLNYDGVTFDVDATGATPTFSAAGLDGPTTRTVALRTRDDDDSLSPISTATVTITNADPTITNVRSTGPVDEGATATVTVIISANDVAGSLDPLTYEFDFDNNGAYETSNSTGRADHTFTDAGNYQVNVRVTDGDGGAATGFVMVVVRDVGPTIGSVSNDGPINEGNSASVTVAAAASSSDTLSYEFDWDNNGTFEVGPQAGNSANHPFADNGSYTVNVRVTDDDGSSVTDSTTVIVNDVLPTISKVGNSGPINEGNNATVTITAAAGGSDTLSYEFDWNNDNVYDSGPQSANSATHLFADNGSYRVNVRVTDDDGNTTTGFTTVTVNDVLPTISSVGNDGPISESSNATVTVNASAGGSDTLRYAFDWDNNGTYEVGPQSANSASHFFADNGVYTVNVRVTDDDGNSVTDSTTVIVNDALPTISIVGNSGPIDEGNNTTVTITAAAGGSDTLSYEFDWNNDNVYDSGPQSANSAMHLFADNGNYRVNVRVTDDDGNTTTSFTTVTVNDVLPTISSVSNSGPINEGNNPTVTVTAAAGNNETLSYEFDWDDNGTYEAGPQASKSASHTFADNGTYRVNIRVTDDDGNATTTFTNVVVNNVAPTAGITGPGIGVLGQPLTFTLRATDASPADQTANFTWSINWGDGSPAQTVTGPDGTTVTHTYTTNGVKNISLTARDKDDGASSTAKSAVTIGPVGLGTDPTTPGKTALFVGGTNGNDTIKLRQSGGGVVVSMNGKNLGTFFPTGRIIIYGLAGNDRIELDKALTRDAILDGGTGNDILIGGAGNDILFGGGGNDTLMGNLGYNLLVGGAGQDKLWANAQNTRSANPKASLLVSGSTAQDGDLAALAAVMGEWTAGRTIAGLLTVQDDRAADALYYRAVDQYFAGLGDKALRVSI